MKTPIFLLIILAVLLSFSVIFTVDETETALLVQLGKPVKVYNEPGLHFKLPFIQNVVFFDDRILDYDAEPKDIITKDKKTLRVDNFAKWKIIDPLLFYQSVKNERGAQERLDDIIYSDLRAELGKHYFIEIIADKRPFIMKTVTIASTHKTKQFGIEIVDVRVKRADLPPENEKAVFQRMSAERERVAKQYRSEGEEESLKLRSQSEKEREIILATAYKQAQTIMGEGDAKALSAYEEAYRKSPELFELLKSMEAYKEVMKEENLLILTPDSKFFRHMKK